MHLRKPLLVVVIALVAVGLLASLATIIYHMSRNSPELPISPQVQDQTPPSGWETYTYPSTKSAFGFRFFHPANFDQIIAIDGGSGVTFASYPDGKIDLHFNFDWQGSSCANAPCNNQKDIRVLVGGKTYNTKQTWPDVRGYYTFKISLRSPDSDSTLDIAARYSGESDLEEINSILDTLTYLPKQVPTSTNGGICGGFAGLSCPSGYYCRTQGSYPDTSGICVKKRFIFF